MAADFSAGIEIVIHSDQGYDFAFSTTFIQEPALRWGVDTVWEDGEAKPMRGRSNSSSGGVDLTPTKATLANTRHSAAFVKLV